MTEIEKQEIIDELEKRFEKKYKGCLTREGTHSVLKEPRNRWFRDDDGSGCSSLMSEVFGSSIISWQVWEAIRKLTCVICGKQYVRHLSEEDHPEEVAEKICELVFNLRKEKNNDKQ